MRGPFTPWRVINIKGDVIFQAIRVWLFYGFYGNRGSFSASTGQYVASTRPVAIFEYHLITSNLYWDRYIHTCPTAANVFNGIVFLKAVQVRSCKLEETGQMGKRRSKCLGIQVSRCALSYLDLQVSSTLARYLSCPPTNHCLHWKV